MSNTVDLSIYIIASLLPLSAAILVFQVNPYHALIIRGILGAVAALVYAVLGAADVALTEALVGTMLSITLYAVAVRSSLLMQLGVLDEQAIDPEKPLTTPEAGSHRGNLEQHIASIQPVVKQLRTLLNQHYMRLEVIPYPNLPALQQALIDKDIHGICLPRSALTLSEQATPVYPLARLKDSTILEVESSVPNPSYHTHVRIRRLHEILQAELPASLTVLTYGDQFANGSSFPSQDSPSLRISDLEEQPL